MKNQSGTIKTNLELDRVVMGGSGGYRRLLGGSDDFSLQTDTHTHFIIIYISSSSTSSSSHCTLRESLPGGQFQSQCQWPHISHRHFGTSLKAETRNPIRCKYKYKSKNTNTGKMERTSLMTAFINTRVPQLKSNTNNNSIQFISAGNH